MTLDLFFNILRKVYIHNCLQTQITFSPEYCLQEFLNYKGHDLAQLLRKFCGNSLRREFDFLRYCTRVSRRRGVESFAMWSCRQREVQATEPAGPKAEVHAAKRGLVLRVEA